MIVTENIATSGFSKCTLCDTSQWHFFQKLSLISRHWANRKWPLHAELQGFQINGDNTEKEGSGSSRFFCMRG